jgi:hypothetical protein
MSMQSSLRALFCALALGAQVGTAWAVVPVTFGTSWDGPATTLQKIVDAEYGAGNINVTTDYIGAHPGDVDPWFWVDDKVSAFLIREVAGNHDRNTLGWYVENGSKPVLHNDGIHDGLIFDGPASAGASTIFMFPQPATRFGFYLNPNGPGDAVNAPEPELFFTDRLFNDLGPDGGGALHPPYDGDVQALIFDVSRFVGTNTWLVCFEDLDSGANPGPCCSTTDNDFNDFVFEVTAWGATPVVPMTFGAVKAKYRR